MKFAKSLDCGYKFISYFLIESSWQVNHRVINFQLKQNGRKILRDFFGE